jgi:hypothetical protein
VWQYLIGDNNPLGPVEVKGLEYESLRIEAGQPAFGYEVTGAWKDPEGTSPTPLELHQTPKSAMEQRAAIWTKKGLHRL